MEIKPIARIHTDFSEKFGVPRQAGLAPSLTGKIVFEPEYKNVRSVKELDGFSHIWLIWEFSQCSDSKFSPTVRPPRLGGNRRVGVFASRSPFRPNRLGLSCVKIEKIETYYHCSKIQEVRYMSKNEMNQNYSDNNKQENKTKNAQQDNQKNKNCRNSSSDYSSSEKNSNKN